MMIRIRSCLLTRGGDWQRIRTDCGQLVFPIPPHCTLHKYQKFWPEIQNYFKQIPLHCTRNKYQKFWPETQKYFSQIQKQYALSKYFFYTQVCLTLSVPRSCYGLAQKNFGNVFMKRSNTTKYKNSNTFSKIWWETEAATFPFQFGASSINNMWVFLHFYMYLFFRSYIFVIVLALKIMFVFVFLISVASSRAKLER